MGFRYCKSDYDNSDYLQDQWCNRLNSANLDLRFWLKNESSGRIYLEQRHSAHIICNRLSSYAAEKLQ